MNQSSQCWWKQHCLNERHLIEICRSFHGIREGVLKYAAGNRNLNWPALETSYTSGGTTSYLFRSSASLPYDYNWECHWSHWWLPTVTPINLYVSQFDFLCKRFPKANLETFRLQNLDWSIFVQLNLLMSFWRLNVVTLHIRANNPKLLPTQPDRRMIMEVLAMG